MKSIAIERKRGLAAADFARDHLQGLGKPVVITDAIEAWPALSKWSFEKLKAAYGADFVPVSLGLNSEVAKLTKFATFIDHLDRPTEELPGFWVDRKSGRPLRAAPPPSESRHYLLDWGAFQKHPELYGDIVPAPGFITDWQLTLGPTMRDMFEWTSGREHFSIYIGAEGALSWLHRDYWHTHGYLAQIRGRKKCLLFSPQDNDLLYDGAVDPERPDFKRFQRFERATMYECTIGPGELLFIPPDWWHHVRGLEKNITVSHNFFNEINFDRYMSRFVRRMPRLVQGVAEMPKWREELGIHWSSRDFLGSDR